MPIDNPGFFGSDNFRENNIHNNRRNNSKERTHRHKLNPGRLSELSPERWVDIICLTLIGIFLIVVACTWATFSETLFANILFPVIYIGSRIVALVAAIGTGIGLLFARFRRRRYWW